ncbi:DMT family transporter [Sorangium sp. So ce315]|uniref:EamA family transporter n=1 Tax=Sorangium sp. So ce315 TaxID=3133299 RepID=UPI003F5E8F81
MAWRQRQRDQGFPDLPAGRRVRARAAALEQPTDLALLVFLGAVQIGLSCVLFSRGMRHAPAVEASLLVRVAPVLNPLRALLLVGERPGPWSIAGGAVILGATAWRTVLAARAAPPQTSLPGSRA